MTEYEIASAIENYVTSHRGVTDFPLSQRQIRDEVDTLRIRFFDEFDNMNKTITNISPFTQIVKVSTEKGDDGMFVNVPYIHQRTNGKLAALFIGSAKGTTPFKIIVGNRRLWSNFDSHTGKAPTAVYSNGKIKFINVAPKNVLIEALFIKPSELRTIGEYDWKSTQYPVPYGLIDSIIGKTAESYLRTRTQNVPHPNNQSDVNVQESAQLKTL